MVLVMMGLLNLELNITQRRRRWGMGSASSISRKYFLHIPLSR